MLRDLRVTLLRTFHSSMSQAYYSYRQDLRRFSKRRQTYPSQPASRLAKSMSPIQLVCCTVEARWKDSLSQSISQHSTNVWPLKCLLYVMLYKASTLTACYPKHTKRSSTNGAHIDDYPYSFSCPVFLKLGVAWL